MSKEKNQFVTSKMVEGITGFNLCAFLIGLEGWRRGLKLNYYVDIHQYSDIRTQGKKLIGRNYSFSSKDRTHYFNQSRGDKVCNEAVRIAQSKQLTKQYLKESGANILDSLQFDKSVTNDEIIEKSKTLGYPLIVKPTYGTLSKGVVINIKNDEELKEALKRVRNKLGFKNVIVEQYFNGDDIRLYVIEDKVVAGIKRVPAKVIGDGVSTIKELIDQKNESRKSNPYLAARPIKIDDEVYEVLQEQGYSLRV
ncbi:ATP-binding protein [Piscibacillus sp. B03]|uniref:ATP-binding protein n=1 Tax=Piscibacillus sp. B03 TaxID=3457430 RepID=UPI003FCE14AB